MKHYFFNQNVIPYSAKPYSGAKVSAALALAGLLLASVPAQAQTKKVTLNTGLLNGAGTFYVDYTLFNGSQIADGNSNVAISNFSLTGGTLGSVLSPTTGDVTGGLGSTLTLKDDGTSSGGLADFAQAFTVTSAASTLSFNVNLSATSIDSGKPDDFYFEILDNATTALATNGPTGVELVNAGFTTLSPTAIGYITQSTSRVGATTSYPGIKATVAAVPEASTGASFGLMMVLGLGGALLGVRSRKLSASAQV